MRLVVTQNMTIDGVIEATGGWFQPSDGGGDTADILDELMRQSAEEDGLLLGRVTFEQFRGYWPARKDDTTGISAHLDRVQKYVVSRTMTDPGWDRSTVLRGSLVEEVRALKARPGRELCVTGSISVVHALAAARLVDEYRLFVYPVAVAQGRRLFADGGGETKLERTDVKTFRSGVVLVSYRVVS